MSDKELMAQIAQVAGAINRHKLQSQGYYGYNHPPTSTRGGSNVYNGYSGYSIPGRGRGRGAPISHVHSRSFNRSLTLNNANKSSTLSSTSSVSPALSAQATQSTSTSSSAQITPTRSIVKPLTPALVPSRHLTLVNKSTPNSPTPGSFSSPTLSPLQPRDLASTSGQQWIQTKGKNMALMNASTFKKTMVAKEKSIRSAKEKKLKLLQVRAKRAQDLRRGIVTMGGKEYSKSADGRKLVMRDTSQDNIIINGVEFQMDPRGNKLVRKPIATAGATSVADSQASNSTSLKLDASSKASPAATPKQFSVGGVVYVRTQSGNLVRASLVQNKLLKKRPFATEGWCEAGINCKNRHVWICPDFVTEAGCKKKCGLPHVPNGGSRDKKTSDGNDISSEVSRGKDKTWTRPGYQLPASPSHASTSRYMDNQDTVSYIDNDASSIGGQNKNRQYNENFIPLDLGDDFEDQQAAMLDEDEEVVMSDQELEEDEEEDEDVSSDGMESADDDIDDEDISEIEGEGEFEDIDGEEGDEKMNEDEYNMYREHEQLQYEDEEDY
ncbi:hypothetical protein FBU30_007100 [Linnemannia zychae]|nr:hypothetical protein FBU30_007100 [Linnemannia zychae]